MTWQQGLAWKARWCRCGGEKSCSQESRLAFGGHGAAAPAPLPLSYPSTSPAQEDMLKTLRVLAGLDLLIDCFGVNWSYLYLQPGQVAT